MCVSNLCTGNERGIHSKWMDGHFLEDFKTQVPRKYHIMVHYPILSSLLSVPLKTETSEHVAVFLYLPFIFVLKCEQTKRKIDIILSVCLSVKR